MRFQSFIPAILWFICTLILLCLPGSSIPKYPWLAMIHADKWIHISLFFILCLLFSYPFRNADPIVVKKQKWFLLILICGVLYGTAMEFVQDEWIPNRSFEWMDIAADSFGCLLAFLFANKRFGLR